MKTSTGARLSRAGYCVSRLQPGLGWQAVVEIVSELLGVPPLDYDGTPDCAGVNFVTLGLGAYRSGTQSALGLHQEGYADEQLHGWLAFYCVETYGQGGETLIVDARSALESLPGRTVSKLLNTEVRFSKPSGIWTPWRPLLEKNVCGELLVRFAEPESGFREVDLRPSSPSLLALMSNAFRRQAMAHSWRAGDLVILDNLRYLHGRNRVEEPARRSLLRMSFPAAEKHHGVARIRESRQ